GAQSFSLGESFADSGHVGVEVAHGGVDLGQGEAELSHSYFLQWGLPRSDPTPKTESPGCAPGLAPSSGFRRSRPPWRLAFPGGDFSPCPSRRSRSFATLPGRRAH